MLTAAVVSLLLLGVLWWEVGGPPWRISPDGQFYLTPSPPRPYGMRPLLPWIFRSRVGWWIICSYAAIAATAVIVGIVGGWPASVLFLGLASTRTNVMFPILTDQVGMLLLTLGVVLPWPWNVLPVLLGAFVNEKVPVFAAALRGDPLLILPLVGSWWFWRKSRKPNDQDPEWIQRPLEEARKKAWDLDWKNLILPWGVGILGLLSVSPVAVILAYVQVAIAQDRARLVQWISPMVVIAAVPLIPSQFLLPLLILHWASPWRRVL